MMTKRNVLLSIVVIFIVAMVVAPYVFRNKPSEIVQPLNKKDFSAISRFDRKHIELEAGISAVEHLIGKPISFHDVLPQTGVAGYAAKLVYKGLDVIYERSSRSVMAFELTDDNYETARGLMVGNRVENVLNTYGKPTYQETNELLYILTGNSGLEQRELAFSVSNDRVKMIQIFVPTP